ncbi:MAG: hypothetical protein LBR07_09090 [Puniceicoccales bacterium]|jgi:hypothetical protein|nr:hypothetical protein [Puniceicoccales bacterium]
MSQSLSADSKKSTATITDCEPPTHGGLGFLHVSLSATITDCEPSTLPVTSTWATAPKSSPATYDEMREQFRRNNEFIARERAAIEARYPRANV